MNKYNSKLSDALLRSSFAAKIVERELRCGS